MEIKSNDNGANNSDSSTEDLQLNQNNQFHADTPYNSNQPQFNQNLQNYPPQQIPQYQYPLQPIYPQQSNNINSSNQAFNTPYQGAYPNSPQNNYDMNGLNYQNPPKLPQNEILVNDIGNDTALNKDNMSCQITMLVYLFAYSITDMIYQIARDLVNIAMIDDFLLILLGVIILIFNLKGRTASNYFLSFYTLLVWFAGTALKFAGYSSIDGYDLDAFVITTTILRLFILLCIALVTCPPSLMKRRRRNNNKK